MLVMVFQLMWEMLNTGLRFPFGSLLYIAPGSVDLYIGIVPASALILKSLVFLTPSYLVASGTGRSFMKSHVDLVIDRGRNTKSSIFISVFGTMLSTLFTVIAEPVLANGSRWFLGSYERFNYGIYFGVNPAYFAGWAVSTFITFCVVSIAEANLGEKKEVIVYNYKKNVQSPRRHHEAGFLVFAMGLITCSFMALLVIPVAAIINFIVIIPMIGGLSTWFLYWSREMDNKMIKEYCKKQPDSFICGME
jgi:uncharacterized membrane protein